MDGLLTADRVRMAGRGGFGTIAFLIYESIEDRDWFRQRIEKYHGKPLEAQPPHANAPTGRLFAHVPHAGGQCYLYWDLDDAAVAAVGTVTCTPDRPHTTDTLTAFWAAHR